MAKHGLVSNYTVKQYKVTKTSCNEDNIKNIVDRNFNNRQQHEVVVSDLTYVNVNTLGNNICIFIDLHAREIISYAARKRKDENLVYKTFTRVNT